MALSGRKRGGRQWCLMAAKGLIRRYGRAMGSNNPITSGLPNKADGWPDTMNMPGKPVWMTVGNQVGQHSVN